MPNSRDPMDCSLPDSSVHGIFLARILEWTAISFSRGFFQPRDGTWVSCIAGRFFTTEPLRSMVVLNCLWLYLIGYVYAVQEPGGKFSSTYQVTPQFSSVTQSCLSLCDPVNCSTPGLPVHHQLPEFSQMSIESVMPLNHLILCRPLLLLPSIFPASGSFQMSQLSASGGQNIGVSASTSVLPMNT